MRNMAWLAKTGTRFLLRSAAWGLIGVSSLTLHATQTTVAGAATTQTATPTMEDVSFRLVDGVPYTTVNGQVLVCDLYLPKGPGPFPAVLYLHGGGWRNGDRKQLRRQAAFLADKGFAGMAIDYRLAPAHPFPAALDDAKTALIWLRQHAKQYNVDPSRIAVVGSSAGGHLAAMLGVQSSDKPSVAKNTTVQAVVAFNGIFDLSAMPPSTMVSDFVGNTCSAAPQQCEAASPLTFVRPGLSPFLILHGTADKTAPFAQAARFVQALQAAHDNAQLFTASGAPHTFWVEPKWTTPSFQAMYTFLTEALLPNGVKRSVK